MFCNDHAYQHVDSLSSESFFILYTKVISGLRWVTPLRSSISDERYFIIRPTKEAAEVVCRVPIVKAQ